MIVLQDNPSATAHHAIYLRLLSSRHILNLEQYPLDDKMIYKFNLAFMQVCRLKNIISCFRESRINQLRIVNGHAQVITKL